MTDIRAVRIKLKPGSLANARAWAQEINTRRSEALESLAHEGIVLEGAFLDQIGSDHYLVYVMKGDIEGSKAVSNASVSAIDAYHNKFKADCWESAQPMEPLVWLERP